MWYILDDHSYFYNIYKFNEFCYKVVRLNGRPSSHKGGFIDPEKVVHYDKKIDPSLSRSRRVVLELALCNKWEYFCTFTIAKEYYDRYNLDRWNKDFKQWLRDFRKKVRRTGKPCDIEYLIVPEQHADGAWHMHGLFRGIGDYLMPFSRLARDGWYLPSDLVDYGYWMWPDYFYKFGFNSMAVIQNPVAVGFYVAKYITKSLSDSVSGNAGVGLGFHLYYPSRGLNRPIKYKSIDRSSHFLDRYLTAHYEFCSTGFVSAGVANADFDWMDISFADPFGLFPPEFSSDPDGYWDAAIDEADNFYYFRQLAFS